MEDAARGRVQRQFCRFASRSAEVLGSAQALALCLFFLLVWALWGPFCHFSDTWQLWINTATNIVCLVMVFLIQNTQNRDSKAINLKLDELIRAKKSARSELMGIERLTDQELAEIEEEFKLLRRAIQTHSWPEVTTDHPPAPAEGRPALRN
jgi:low affinity Fe/Cu permease